MRTASESMAQSLAEHLTIQASSHSDPSDAGDSARGSIRDMPALATQGRHDNDPKHTHAGSSVSQSTMAFASLACVVDVCGFLGSCLSVSPGIVLFCVVALVLVLMRSPLLSFY